MESIAFYQVNVFLMKIFSLKLVVRIRDVNRAEISGPARKIFSALPGINVL